MARREPRFYLKILFIITAFIIIASYSYFRAEVLIAGPEITVSEPKDGAYYTSPEVALKGKAKNISFLSLNGLPIYTDDNGNFGRKLLLSNGYNIITVVAKDKFNRVVEKSIQLTYEKSDVTISPTNNAVGSTTLNLNNRLPQ